MTNHSEAAGAPGSGDISEQLEHRGPEGRPRPEHELSAERPASEECRQEAAACPEQDRRKPARRAQGRRSEPNSDGGAAALTGCEEATGEASAVPDHERTSAVSQAYLSAHPSISQGHEYPVYAAHEDPSKPTGHHKASGHAEDGLSHDACDEHQVTLRTPAELADALPYLLGYRPEDSIVLVALHERDGRGRFGGRARLGIPAQVGDWPAVAGQLAHGLVTGSARRGARPESMVAFLCQEPSTGESGHEVMERLRPLAQLLRRACGSLDVPVIEALCISGGRFWSYCCPARGCCPTEGEAMGLPGTSVLAAAATYAGLQVRGTLRDLRVRLTPWETAAARQQEAALDAACTAVLPRMLDEAGRAAVAEETLALAHRFVCRLADAPPVSGTLQADLRDDTLLGHEDAAMLILGLQDRSTRDRAAEWMEDDEAGPALRLWRALARRCVGAYGEHAAAPLTLAGWVAWSSGDGLEAREALAMALAADPDYLFARLLHQACNEGVDPESIRRCLRSERENRLESTGGRADALSGPKRKDTAQEPGKPHACEAQSSVTAPRRRRRARSEGSLAGHVARRSPKTPGDRRPRSTGGTSPAGDGLGRAIDGTSRRTQAHRDVQDRNEAAET